MTVWDESANRRLHDALAVQRTFLENVFSIMRLLEAQLVARGWELVRISGHAATRNGCGSGLKDFVRGDWVTNQVGLGFVPAARTKKVDEANTATVVPPTGLDLLVVQVRWLDLSPAGPVVWAARLEVTPDGAPSPRWEAYQSDALRKLSPDPTRAGRVRPERQEKAKRAVRIDGSYRELPVTLLATETDVVLRLIDPEPPPRA